MPSTIVSATATVVAVVAATATVVAVVACASAATSGTPLSNVIVSETVVVQTHCTAAASALSVWAPKDRLPCRARDASPHHQDLAQ